MAITSIQFLISPSVTATNGSTTINVTGSIDCSKVYSGTVILIAGSQAAEAVSGTVADVNGDSTITLRLPWPEATTTARMVSFNSIEGLTEAIRRAREVIANIDSSDATIQQQLIDIQANLTLIGDAPVLAQQVADDKAVVLSYLNTAVDTEISTGVYSLLHYQTKVLSDYNQIQTWHGDVDGWQQQVTQDKGTVNTAKEDALQAVIDAQAEVVLAADQVTLAANQVGLATQQVGFAADEKDAAIIARDLAADWADKPTEVTTGRFSAKYWSDNAAAIVGGDFVPQTTTINGYALTTNITLAVGDISDLATELSGKSDTGHVHTTGNITGLDATLATLAALELKVKQAKILALAGI